MALTVNYYSMHQWPTHFMTCRLLVLILSPEPHTSEVKLKRGNFHICPHDSQGRYGSRLATTPPHPLCFLQTSDQWASLSHSIIWATVSQRCSAAAGKPPMFSEHITRFMATQYRRFVVATIDPIPCDNDPVAGIRLIGGKVTAEAEWWLQMGERSIVLTSIELVKSIYNGNTRCCKSVGRPGKKILDTDNN